jgi:hypothetical protein
MLLQFILRRCCSVVVEDGWSPLAIQVVTSKAGKAGLSRPCLSHLLAGVCLRNSYYRFLDLTGAIGKGEVRLRLVGNHLVTLNQAGPQTGS